MADTRSTSASFAAAQADTKSPLDMTAILALCGGDPVFAAKLLDKFRATAAGELSKIADALARDDAVALTRAAHTVKSMAAYASARAATALAPQIELLAGTNRLADVEPLAVALRVEIERAVAWINQRGMADAA